MALTFPLGLHGYFGYKKLPAAGLSTRGARRPGVMELRRRTLARVLTWRIGGIALATILGWLLLDDPVSGASFGLAYNGIRAGTQYLHERLWLRTRWGLTALPPQEVP